MGTPMEWPPPSTRDTVGTLKEAIISAMARPASTSPPTVLSKTRSPSTDLSSSIMASFGKTCSYLVVLLWDGADSCPSTSPMIVRSSTLYLLEFSFKITCPISRICLFCCSSFSTDSFFSLSASLSSLCCIKNTSTQSYGGIICKSD